MSAWYRERPHSFAVALKAAREMLGASPALVAKGSIEAEAEQLVLAAYRHVSGKQLSRMELFSRAQDRFPEEAADKLLAIAGARAEGKTLQHLTGIQYFLDHEYEVGPDVLVPRPETEVLVAGAIADLKAGSFLPVLGLEIGIGSGAISIELLTAFTQLEMVATELTAEAEARATANARRILGLPDADKRLRIVRAKDALEVWAPLRTAIGERRADFMISNPPYLIASDPIEDEVRANEPSTALFAPAQDPLHFYREIALHAQHYLVPGGRVYVELAPERATEVLRLFEDSGWLAQIQPDLTGRDRVLFASLNRKR